jgi:DNA polymerase III epsilon subunit-like protein
MFYPCKYPFNRAKDKGFLGKNKSLKPFDFTPLNSLPLHAVHYAIVDIETTGGSPKDSKITEIAIYKHDGTQVIDKFVTLVNPEMRIPEFIVRLTGINDKMVENAPRFFELAKEIVEFTEGCVFVAHNIYAGLSAPVW